LCVKISVYFEEIKSITKSEQRAFKLYTEPFNGHLATNIISVIFVDQIPLKK